MIDPPPMPFLYFFNTIVIFRGFQLFMNEIQIISCTRSLQHTSARNQTSNVLTPFSPDADSVNEPSSPPLTHSPVIMRNEQNPYLQRFLKSLPPPEVLVDEELPHPILHRCSRCPSCVETLSEWRGDEERRETHHTSGKLGTLRKRRERNEKERSME